MTFPKNVHVFSIVLIVGYVSTQEYFEEHHKVPFKTPNIGRLKEIPKRFLVTGPNVKTEFEKYINDIQDLAREENITIIYKVKVETSKTPRKKKSKKSKSMYKKKKSLKYNVPLKKKSMKLSSFEIIMRKVAQENGQKAKEKQDALIVTTERIIYTASTKSAFLGKYKPIIGQIRTNYTKIIKPVRKKEIVLQ